MPATRDWSKADLSKVDWDQLVAQLKAIHYKRYIRSDDPVGDARAAYVKMGLTPPPDEKIKAWLRYWTGYGD